MEGEREGGREKEGDGEGGREREKGKEMQNRTTMCPAAHFCNLHDFFVRPCSTSPHKEFREGALPMESYCQKPEKSAGKQALYCYSLRP
jgi:hypothetical protein